MKAMVMGGLGLSNLALRDVPDPKPGPGHHDKRAVGQVGRHAGAGRGEGAGLVARKRVRELDDERAGRRNAAHRKAGGQRVAQRVEACEVQVQLLPRGRRHRKGGQGRNQREGDECEKNDERSAHGNQATSRRLAPVAVF